MPQATEDGPRIGPAQYLTLAVALVAGGLAAYSTLRFLRVNSAPLEVGTYTDERWQMFTTRLGMMDSAMRTFDTQLSALQYGLLVDSAQSTPAAATIQLHALRQEVEQLHSDVQSLKSVVMEDPAKAIQSVLTRRELDGLREKTRDDISGMRIEIGRIYDLTKWFLGIQATMVLGLIGLAVGQFRRSA